MTNPSRGEMDLTLGEQTYKLAATFNQALELELRLSASLYGVVEALTTAGGMSIRTIGTVLHAGILGGYEKENKDLVDAPSLQEVLEAVFTAGAVNLSEPTTQLLKMWLMTDKQAQEAEEAAKKD